MTNILLVYQEIPDNLKIYSLSLRYIDIEKLSKCHNKLINCDNWDEEDWLIKFIENLEKEEKSLLYDGLKETSVIHLFMDSPDYDVKIIITGIVL